VFLDDGSLNEPEFAAGKSNDVAIERFKLEIVDGIFGMHDASGIDFVEDHLCLEGLFGIRVVGVFDLAHIERVLKNGRVDNRGSDIQKLSSDGSVMGHSLVLLGGSGTEKVDTEVERLLELGLGQAGSHIGSALNNWVKGQV